MATKFSERRQGKQRRRSRGKRTRRAVKGAGSGGGQGGQARAGGQGGAGSGGGQGEQRRRPRGAGAGGRTSFWLYQGPAYCGLAWPNKFLMFSDPVPHQVTMQLQQFQAVTVWDRLFRMRKKNFLSTGPETSRKRSVCSRASKRTIERVFECHTKYLNTYFDIHMRYSNIFYKII